MIISDLGNGICSFLQWSLETGLAGGRGTSPRRAGRCESEVTLPPPHPPKPLTGPPGTMARDQPNVSDLLPLLESSDLRQLDQVKALLNEHLSTGQTAAPWRGLWESFEEIRKKKTVRDIGLIPILYFSFLFSFSFFFSRAPTIRRG